MCKSRRVMMTAACLVILQTWPTFAAELKIVHIDVGQGDSTLILGPPGTDGGRVSVLVDAGNITFQGGRDGGRIVGAVLAANGIRELDFFIATHYDADHVGGVITGQSHIHGSSFVLGPDGAPGAPGDDDGNGTADWLDGSAMERPDPAELGRGDDVRVGTFIDRGDSPPGTTATYRKYVGIANAMGTRLKFETLSDFDTFEIDLGGGARMVPLSSNGFVRGRTTRVPRVNTENERSLCFLVTFGGFDYLIGGDTIGRAFGSEDAQVEKAIAEYLESEGVEVDVLHVNHHGANNASDADFLNRIRAEVAIISLGDDNNHHHPNHEVLKRLAAAGSRIYQTNWGTTEGETPPEVRRLQSIIHGDIVITTDGDSFEVSTRRTFFVDEP